MISPRPRRISSFHRVFALFRRLAAGVVLAATAAALTAAESAKSFDIPAGPAEKALKAFSLQSGVEVLFATTTVTRITTRPVTGNFTVRAALERLIEGTGLVAQQESNGGFSITRDPNAGRAAAQPDRPALPATDSSAPRHTGADGIVHGRVQHHVTGQYLPNARVTVPGTSLVALTDEAGAYRLTNVPAGPVTLEVFYTGLDAQRVPVQVGSGQTVTADVRLTSAARYGRETGAIAMSSYIVAAEKDAEGEALATNEQRFAPNIKNVVATDALGDIRGDSVGDFLKFLPGMIGEYSGDEIVGLSVRGLGTDMTTFTIDGAGTVSAGSASSREVRLLGLSLNNTSRIEVTKVPRPSSPADSLAGSVNMVSKSAFERSSAQLRYGLSLVGNSDNLRWGKSPSNFDKMTRKVQPNADFDYTLPLTPNLGFVVAGMHSNKYNPQHLTTLAYTTAGTGTGASVEQPFLQTHTLAHGPRNQERNSASLKVDWRPLRHTVLSLGYQVNNYTIEGGFLNWTTNSGNNATPTPAGPNAVAFSYGPDFTVGATGRGAVTMNPTAATQGGRNDAVTFNLRFNDGRWKLDAGFSTTDSSSFRRSNEAGHFGSVAISMLNPVRVSYADITPDRPGATRVFDNGNREVDIYNLDNYRLTGATSVSHTNLATFDTGSLDLRRTVDFLPFPASVQVGGRQSRQTRDKRLRTENWTYNGPDGNAATPDSPAPYAMQRYRPAYSHYGYRNVPYVSPHRLHDAWLANPVLFAKTPAQLVTEARDGITNSEFLEETVSAAYLETEFRLLANRLRVLTGVRFEDTTVAGVGPLFDPAAVFQRDASGRFLRNAAGARLRRPEAGAAGSMEELRLTSKEREYRAERSYDGYYPSVHLTYSFRDNLLLRAAYAGTYGRPEFANIIPNSTINEADLTEDQLADPNVIPGTITIRNSGLRPWSADNYDLSLEYYTPQGGTLSAGLFLKEISDFFGDEVRIATAADLADLGLDSQYLGWRLSTKYNSGRARIAGAEVSVRHSLAPLGAWGRHFLVFVNGTKMDLDGSQDANFTSFVSESANWGVTFNRQRFSVLAKWNYVGSRPRGVLAALGAGGREYWKARTTLDVNLGVQITARLRLTASFSNLLNEPHTLVRYGAQTPDYARQYRRGEYGVAMTAGIRGTF